jgi:fructose-1,6-bisphosphatase I / sedoheptulose-1,7-bisphosphatase
MYFGRTTLSKFLIEQTRGTADSSLAALLVDVAAAVKAIAAMTAKGALGLAERLGDDSMSSPANASDPPGLAAGSRPLDALGNEIVLRYCEWGGLLAGMASEEMVEPYLIPQEYDRGRYLLLFDPLHGSSSADVNGLLGTTFSVLPHPRAGLPQAADFLQPGRALLAAGYALYGPSTMLVLSVGKGTHGFTLDRETGNFLLTHPDLRVSDGVDELAINTTNERFWEPPVTRYVRECRAGETDVRSRDFKIRWIGSTVAQVHRVLVRGGIYMYPRDFKDAARPGRLKLLFEANPLGYLIEQAGGRASTGRGPLLEVPPEDLHQRVPVMLGAGEEIERLERYHREYDAGDDKPFVSPLFNERSLFRPSARA